MEVTEDVSQPEIRIILDYWLAKRDTGIVPPVTAINPAEIPPELLPWLFLFHREDQGRFRCRLVGTGIVRINGRDSTGQYLDDIMHDSEKDHRIRLFDQAIQTGMPVCYRGRRSITEDTERAFTRLLLPVSGAPDIIDYVFGITRFGPLEPIAKQSAGRTPRIPMKSKPLHYFGRTAIA